MHTFFRLFTIMAVLVTTMGLGHGSQAQTVAAGSLIRVADSNAVYYVGNDGRRYTFPNSKTYHTWFEDFSEVQVVSSFSAYPLGGNVAYRPGTRLIKIESDNKVFAVEPGNVLRWVPTEEVAAALFGSDWNKQIDDVPVIFFSDYVVETTYEASALSATEHPLGSVIQYDGFATKYLIDYIDGLVVKRVVDSAAFSGNRFQEQFVRTVGTDIVYSDGAVVAEQEAPLKDLKRTKIVRIVETPTTPVPGSPTLDSPAIFVDSLAADDGAGTLASPYNTMNEAAAIAPAGVTIYVRGGSSDPRVYEEEFVFAKSGISGSPITLKPYPSEKIAFKTDDVIDFSVSHWNVSDISFDHSNGGDPLMNVRGNNNTFTNVSFANGSGYGVVIPATIHDNTFTNVTFDTFSTACFAIEKKAYNITIDNSTFNTCGTNAIDFDIDAGTLLQDFARKVVVKNSTFNGGVSGMAIQGVDDVVITNNTFTGYTGTVMNVLIDPRNVDIIGNTIAESRSGIYVASSTGRTPSLIDIINNVLYQMGGDYILKFDDVDSLRVVHNTLADSEAPGVIVAAGGVSSGMIRNNMFYNTGDNLIDIAQKAIKSNSGWFGSSIPSGLDGSNDVTPVSTTTSPFVNSEARDYTLKSGEAAVDAAIEIGLTTTDRAGNPRVKGISPDIGAYELQ